MSDGRGIKHLAKRKFKRMPKRRKVGSVMGDRDYINRLEQNIMPKKLMSEANFAENSLIRNKGVENHNYSEYTKNLYKSIDLTN